MSDVGPGTGEHDRARRARRPIDVVVDGTDGAGKTACVRFLLADVVTVMRHAAQAKDKESWLQAVRGGPDTSA